eukprot:5098894-Amphidinium_carterae.1
MDHFPQAARVKLSIQYHLNTLLALGCRKTNNNSNCSRTEHLIRVRYDIDWRQTSSRDTKSEVNQVTVPT